MSELSLHNAHDCSALFYVYVKHAHSDFMHVGVFASRAIADEWWRVVSTCPNTALRESIRRIRPQYYTQRSLADVTETLTDSQCAPQFKDLVFFAMVSGIGISRFTVIPADEGRDLVSGQTFYIRSKTSPSVYWHCSWRDNLHLSTTERTLFRISRTEPNSDGSVMIGSDEIAVQVVDKNDVLDFHPLDGDTLMVVFGSGGHAPSLRIKLDLFTHSFFVADNDRHRVLLSMHLVEGAGEPWEFV